MSDQSLRVHDPPGCSTTGSQSGASRCTSRAKASPGRSIHPRGRCRPAGTWSVPQCTGIDDGAGLEDGEWVTVGARDQTRVRLVPAVHVHRPMPHRPNDAHGHLVQSSSATVWVAGDTELYPDMATLAEMAMSG